MELLNKIVTGASFFAVILQTFCAVINEICLILMYLQYCSRLSCCEGFGGQILLVERSDLRHCMKYSIRSPNLLDESLQSIWQFLVLF